MASLTTDNPSVSAAPKRKSVIFVRSSLGREEGEITEIVAEVSIPEEGGWGWVVLVSSFASLFILDGIFITFGTLFTDIMNDLQVEGYLVAFINSVGYAMYFTSGPIASAVINRYGFRECAMIGSVISSLSLLCSYFSQTYTTVLLCYGLLNGFGASLVSMASCLVVGFYFERLRSLVFAITLCGSSTGATVMSIVNNYLVQLVGWRVTTLLHTGMFAFIYFLAMTYKPILPLFVTKTMDVPTVVTTNLPSFSRIHSKDSHSEVGLTERLFNVVSNSHFPTAADLVQERELMVPTTKASTSVIAAPKYTLSTTIDGAISERQLKQVQSLVTHTEQSQAVQVTLVIEPPKKRSFWARICMWQKQPRDARPMYRDDVFYEGKIQNLDAYKHNVSTTAAKDRLAIEYHLAVSRAATVEDLSEKSIFPIAMRRVLATMFDPELLQRKSFLLMCISAFLNYMGAPIPYIFLKDRNLLEGMDLVDCGRLLSFIGLTSTVGRLIIAAIADKLSLVGLYVFAVSMTAAGTMAFNFSFNIYYQYTCAGVFGFFISCLVSLRTLSIVELYGLEKLTNATGINLLFQGVACLISTPIASIIKDVYGYAISFYMAGLFLFLCGVTMMPINYLARKEAMATLPVVHYNEQVVDILKPRKSSIKKSVDMGK